jgi:hypothetical protein
MNTTKIVIYIILILILALYIYISYRYEQIKSLETFVNNNKSNNPENNDNCINGNTNINDNNLIIKANQFLQPINTDIKEEWKEIITKYIAEFNPINLKARGVLSHKELIDKYSSQKCLLHISKDNINSINTMLQSELSSYNKIYPLIAKIIPQIRIIKCSQDLEFGFPHTHRNIIIFSEQYFHNPSITTFIHECIHIDQRLNPSKYLQLYSNWGFVKYDIKKIKNTDDNNTNGDFTDIIRRSRSNPDGRDINWLWISHTSNQAYWIGAVYNSHNPQSIADVENRIYKIENVNAGYNTIEKIGKYTGSSTLIHENTDFISTFGNIKNNNYHPNEIAAELAVKVFNDDSVNGSISSKSNSPALKSFVNIL